MTVKEYKVLIVPDIHMKDYNPDTRYKYPEELMTYLNQIVAIIKQEKVDIVNFLGDIFDGSFVKPKSTKYLLEYLKILNEMKTQAKLYTVMGNHERNNMNKDNPFYHITDINSEVISKDIQYYNMSHYAPIPLLECVDYLKVNNTLFYFKHFTRNNIIATLPDKTGVKYHIGLFHQSFDSQVLAQSLEYMYGFEVLSKINRGGVIKEEDLGGFDHAFFGHVHIPVPTFQVGKTKVDFIGSIGRNSSLENYESLNLPLITIGDGFKVEYLKFELLPFFESFRKNILNTNKQQYINKKKLKETLSVIDKDYDLREVFEVYETTPLHSIIKQSIVDDKDIYTSEMTDKFRLLQQGKPNI